MLGKARFSCALLACATATMLASAPAQALTGLPPGFQERTISGAGTSTSFAVAPDGRIFIAEKKGRVRVILANGQLRTAPVIDISAHVNNYVDHGLLGITVDKDFLTNGWVYLYYVYENNTNKPTAAKVSRVTRITVNPDNTVANALAPETTILGTYTPTPTSQAQGCPAANNFIDCIPAETTSHNGGTLRTDPRDGSLWLSVGDANLGYHDPNRFRPYDETSLAGKIIHIDKNGQGVAGHPFCPTNVDLASVCTKIYAKGFRNPWRLTLRPNGLGPVVGDVGEATWEEIDLVEAGRSYGWPCYEATHHFAPLASVATCQAEYAKEGTAQADAQPIHEYQHGQYGAAVIGGPLYTGTQFPPAYRNSVYYGDIVFGVIRRVVLDASDHVTEVDDFANDFVGVDLQLMPDGTLGYLTLGGTVGFISFDSSNLPPVPVVHRDVDSGALPLAVQFSGDASSDPEGTPLSYDWDFGDGSAHSTSTNPAHTYTRAGHFTATLTVTDGGGLRASSSTDVFPGDSAPQVRITAPADGSLYSDGVTVNLQGDGSDPEDGTLTGSALSWTILLHHETHVHPFNTLTGTSASFTPLTDHDTDSYYEVTLTATDAQGLQRSTSIQLRPRTVTLTLASDPAGAPLAYGGKDHVAPYTTQSAVGYQATINAGSPFTSNGTPWQFASWSDGGAQSHTVAIPGHDLTLTARYTNDLDSPETTITSGPATEYTPSHYATFEFTSDEAGSTFECLVDAGPYAPCTSPYKTKYLDQGYHTFAVRAIDRAGNYDPSPARQTWKVITSSGS